MIFKTGDILATWHPFEFTKVSLGMAAIRTLTKGPDHLAIVNVENGKIRITEASYVCKGVIELPYNSWRILHEDARIQLLRPKTYPNEAMFKEIVGAQYGKFYDTETVLWHHLYYQLIKKFKPDFEWQGPTENGKAIDKFYCSELVAYCYDMEEWWNKSPADIYNSDLFEKTNHIMIA